MNIQSGHTVLGIDNFDKDGHIKISIQGFNYRVETVLDIDQTDMLINDLIKKIIKQTNDTK